MEGVICQGLLREKALRETPPEERSSSSLRIQVIQERLEKVQCQEMRHLDEVVAEENFYALEENIQEDRGSR